MWAGRRVLPEFHFLDAVRIGGLGKPDRQRQPGDIDPKKVVLIADMGLVSDQPIALDYRPSMGKPRVITLRWESRDLAPGVPFGGGKRWIEIARDIKGFAAMVGL